MSDASSGVFKNEVGGGQVQIKGDKPEGPFISSVEYLDSLIPWCGVGCLGFYLNLDWPSCFGVAVSGDCCCCTYKHEWCRILCGGVDAEEPVRPCCFNWCGEDMCNCSAHPDSTDSHSYLKKYPNDWFSLANIHHKCGDCKTLCHLQVVACGLECRIALPTNSRTTTPWFWNLFGWTFNYQWSMPMSCFSSIGDLKDQTAGDFISTVSRHAQHNRVSDLLWRFLFQPR
jgi:hypothetical protein